MPELEAVIGLEVHAQLRTRSKIFCSCEVRFGAPPNSLTCPVCLGMPGALPVLNRGAVGLAIRLALALECAVRTRSVFARKNYFYPDLPKGYQISQYDQPLAERGRLAIEEPGGAKRDIGITRVHMEEDAGKLIHEGPLAVEGASLVDFNRAGTPLVEIVGEPELRSPEEAYEYLTRLKSILTYTEVCDGNMEEGSLRCDANVSLREKGTRPFGTRVELKNLNSFRNVERALRYEIGRQEEVLRSGGAIVQETLLYDAEAAATRPMRSKEEAHDYRYFPDPDLLPLTVSETWIEEIGRELPELPAARRARFVAAYALSEADATLLTLEKPLADYFEEAVRGGAPPPEASGASVRARRRNPVRGSPEDRREPADGSAASGRDEGIGTARSDGRAAAERTGGGAADRTGGGADERTGGATGARTGEAAADRTGEAAADRTGEAASPPPESGGERGFAAPPREVAKRLLREVMKTMKDEALTSADLARRYPPRFIAELAKLQQDGAINGPTASEVFEYSWLLAGALERAEAKRGPGEWEGTGIVGTGAFAEAAARGIVGASDAGPARRDASTLTFLGFGLRSPAIQRFPEGASLEEVFALARTASATEPPLSGFVVPQNDPVYVNGRLTADRSLVPPDWAFVASAAAIKGSAARPPEVSASPAAIVTAFGLGQISDEGVIRRAVEDAVAGNPRQREQYHAGKEALFGYFVGQVMKATGGRANPALVNRFLKERLSAKT